MDKIKFVNGQAPYINDESLNQMQDNIEQHRYQLKLESSIADNSEMTLPAYYRVGTQCLEVYFEGELLEKDVHYEEIGEKDSLSNKIKILDWGESIEAGFSFSFVIQGMYEEASI